MESSDPFSDYLFQCGERFADNQQRLRTPTTRLRAPPPREDGENPLQGVVCNGGRMFYTRYSHLIHRSRWLIVALWLVATAASVLFLPSLQKVVANKGTTYLPNTASSVVANNWSQQIGKSSQSPSSMIVAIHDARGLDAADKSYFTDTLRRIAAHKAQYHVQAVTAAFNSGSGGQASFTSKDGTTSIALVGLPGTSGQPTNDAAFTALNRAFANAPAGAKVYFTGDARIQQDNLTISQNGVAKSATVTVVLVLVILLFVFRSLVSPIVTLLSIGMSFLITSGIVAWLAEQGLPTSTFTQTFLIAILFGAGTDYSIIIMNRFREELTHGHPTREEALHATLKAVGKTVLFSGLTVFVSFAILYFARFGLYRSAVGVSVGMLVTLLTCLIFIPALLSILGSTLFWPRRPKVGAAHAPFKFWSWTAGASIRRPWAMLAGMLVVLLPVALLFSNRLTYDPMTDIPQAPSVKGFHVIAKSFGQGKVMPVSVVLHTTADLRTPAGLATIESVTRTLSAAKGVAEVDSATSPTGSPITSLHLANQDIVVSQNLAKIESGLTQLQSSLAGAGTSRAQSQAGISKLKAGSAEVANGLEQLQQSLVTVSGKTRDLATGANQLTAGTRALQTGVQQLTNGLQSLQTGTSGLQNGLAQLQQGSAGVASGSTQLAAAQIKLQTAAQDLADALAQWAKTHPTDGANPSWQQISALAAALSSGETKSAAAADQLATGAGQFSGATAKLVQGATKLQRAAGQLASGGQQLGAQVPKLMNGTQKLASGSQALAGGLDQLANGSGKLISGSQQVTQGIGQVGTGMGQLYSGYAKTDAAVARISSGVGQVTRYLQQSGSAGQHQNPGFYVPESTIQTNAGLQESMNNYISADGHVAKFSVILTADPYSTAALAEIPVLERTASTALSASPIHTGQVLATGATASQANLNSVASSDFVRTMAIVLCAIAVLLMVMLRSVFTPLYIIASLAGTYFVSMGILQTVVVRVLHEPGISWAAPFFVFLLLVALGVDYSIFLMSRYEEEIPQAKNLAEAMRTAMIRMGGVVYSAAIIMGGTFGSLMASGVTTLLELALGVVIGLFVYTTVFLAFFVPAAAAVVGDGHVWPFGWRAGLERAGVNRSLRPAEDKG